MRFRSILSWIALALMAGFVLGCAGSDLNLGDVSGTVTLDGEPLADAQVIFTPMTGGRPAAGKTDSNGKYELIFSRDAEGALLGEHVVEITTADEIPNDEDDTVEMIPEKVPAKYNNDTELRAVIEEGKNVSDSPLESGGEIVQAPEAAESDE